MGNESSTSLKSNKSGIVVVAKPDEESNESSHPGLEHCPRFQPLLPTSLNIPETRPLISELVKQIDHKSCLTLCCNLQSHLQQCSEAVKFDQIALTSRIKEVDRISTAVMLRLADRQKVSQKHVEHTKKVEEIASTLARVQVHLERTICLANELNSLLPSDLQLEKIQL